MILILLELLRKEVMVLDLYKLRIFIQKIFIPITIMFVPHEKIRPLNVKIPFLYLFIIIIFAFTGFIYVFNVAVDTAEYYMMKKKLEHYTAQLEEVDTTIKSLKMIEKEFKRLFSLKTKEKILENMDVSDSGSVNIDNLKYKIKETIENVGVIRDYLRTQRDIYFATPIGLPVDGRISSGYGIRENPWEGLREFHSGIDISTAPGTPVKATADGIVSFSGWSGSNGNLVAIEHGHGFSTFYAHNKENLVKVGQKVKRNQIIAYAGSTGNATGPHVHYEIWKDGRHINPYEYIKRRL